MSKFTVTVYDKSKSDSIKFNRNNTRSVYQCSSLLDAITLQREYSEEYGLYNITIFPTKIKCADVVIEIPIKTYQMDMFYYEYRKNL